MWPHELQYGNHVVVLVVLVVVVVVGAVVVGVSSDLLCERHPPPRLEDGEHEHLRNTPTSAEVSAGLLRQWALLGYAGGAGARCTWATSVGSRLPPPAVA